MLRSRLRPVVAASRTALRAAGARPSVRRWLEIAASEVTAALTDTVDEARYGAAYFGRSRPKQTDAGLVSGYARYDRSSSQMNLAAYLVWRELSAIRALDVGAAYGYMVEALRDLGFDAVGVEYSEHAARHASPGAAGHLLQGDVSAGLPFRDAQFDLVTIFETLEHLPPKVIPDVLGELRRVCSGFLVATIPSFGPNAHGADGFLDHKVRDDVIDSYYQRGPQYTGPVPYEDLYPDAAGLPAEGHLTIASFAWWTDRFAEAGFLRCGAVEERLAPELRRFGVANLWNLYVMRVPQVDEPSTAPRTDEELRAAQRRLRLRPKEQPDPPPSRYPAAGVGAS
ncbi:MAG: class I SAM-dependent methyltransferase [Candidatus Dormibacteria bacterium]